MSQKQTPTPLKMNKPKVSVIISTYNRAKHYLPRAIESVLNQTFKDFELLIVDDASTDNTFKVIKDYSDKDPRIKAWSLKKNSGSDCHPKNMGLLASEGEYIAYLDDDCEFHPYHLEVLLKAFDRTRDLDVAYCDMWIYDEDKEGDEGQQAISLNFDSQFLMKRNYIDSSEVLHKREWAMKVGGFDESLPKFIDWNMWVRMRKAGAKFQRVPMIATNYYTHKDTKSRRVETESWFDEELGMTMFKPTFNPPGCKIYLDYLGNINPRENNPRVAIYTITYDRLEYTKRMWASLKKSTKYPFTWCVFDNGSKDGTAEWIINQTKAWSGSSSNKGITYASNHLLNMIEEKLDPDIIIKVDNDVEFLTFGWLEDMIELWKKNHLLYMSPYPEGLVHNPGGAPRIGSAFIGDEFIEVAPHIGGMCAMIDARAYKKFRWTDKFLHGNQDREASEAFKKQGFMPMYYPKHRIIHMDTTEGQQQKFPDYFERRKKEKTTQV